MGRPLKIAKAQAVITITATAGTTEIVTTSANLTALGIIPNMPFIPATNVGGMVAGTTYWILNVLSDNTFTVSETPIDANPTLTPYNLSSAGPVTVATTVAPVDAYFNNPNGGTGYPATNANTYSVVGGNTAIYGKQVLCNVAIGQNGTGNVFASTSSNIVVGLGTDFANVATGTHLYAVWAGGEVQLLGTTTSTAGDITVAVANTAASGNIIGTSGDATTLVVNTPVTFDASFGNLTANTTYFVKTIANTDAFTVSLTPGGAPVQLTSNASVTGNAVQNQVVLDDDSANNASGATGYGDPFIQALPEDGYIVRQKGKTKYLVTGTVTGLTGTCYTANVANTALTPNTMTITATYANSATSLVSTVNDHTAILFPATVDPSALTPGTAYTIYSTGDTIWSEVGSASDMTGTTFVATATGSGTGTAVLANVNPDAIATFNTAVTTVAANALVPGVTYVVASLGNTDWSVVGATGAVVGTMFTATAAGTGTGTATIAGAFGPIVTITGA